MTIRGELTELDVPGLLQLISTHGKSGTLVVEDDRDQQVSILFEEGDIVGAEFSQRGEPQRLGELLVKAEILKPEDLEWALREQKMRGVRLGDLLITESKIDRQDLADILRVQVYETVLRVFTWKHGRFELRQGLPDFERGVMQRIRTDHVLMDSFRMVDEWPQIKRWVPSFDRIVEKTEVGEKVHRPATPSGGEIGGGLTDSEWLLLDLSAQHLSVQRAIYRSRLGEFEACKALKGLQEKGLVRLVVAGEALTKRLVVGGRRRWDALAALAGLRVALIAMLLLTALALLIPPLVGSRAGRVLELLLGPSTTGLAAEIVEARAQVVSEALGLYRMEKGAPPYTLSDLVRAGLVSGLDVRLAERRYRYQREPDGRLVAADGSAPAS